MPARSERIYIIPGDKSVPLQQLQFPGWWNRREFFKQFREREIDTNNPFYVDYGYLLTVGEAIAWNNSCQEEYLAANQHIRPQLKQDMQQLTEYLKKAKWVIVESYEWESGLS